MEQLGPTELPSTEPRETKQYHARDRGPVSHFCSDQNTMSLYRKFPAAMDPRPGSYLGPPAPQANENDDGSRRDAASREILTSQSIPTAVE
ncbi:hypothetical protein CLCR_09348 [Cladophialophora carrionii]|uniref:Uncharacterized protein n=1 Tax=Cladophialophora carrionii TaxID=86049 RepID=A0A1C1CRK7_9EURO|nr:hypothetical protein CLCR_09348 [Cladophialophora carrionii]